MGGAVTAETPSVNPCEECGYDMGRNYIECTTIGECPECGHTFEPEVYEDPHLDDEYVNDQESEEIYIEQQASSDIVYGRIYLPHGYCWDDVSHWNVRRDILNITWDNGNEWSTELEFVHNDPDPSGDYSAYNADRDLLGEY